MMSSPRVGVVRDSMFNNPRIVKAPLGQSRSRGFSVPGPDFTFGVSSSHDQGGVAQVLSSWRVASHHGPSAPVLPPVVDFVALNQDAVKSGIVTAKQLSQYRARRPCRPQRITEQQRRAQPITEQQRKGLVPDIVFGLTNRPDSPLDRLLAHEYGHRWIRDQLKRNQTETQRLSAARMKLGSISETRTSLLRKTHTLPQNQVQTRSRPNHFSQVQAALDTFRDPQTRTRSLRAQERESGSRKGPQGTYKLD